MFKIPKPWKEYFTHYPNGYTLLEMLSSWATKANEMKEDLDGKTDRTGDHQGTWQGLQPIESESGLAGMVSEHDDKFNNNVFPHIDDITIHKHIYFDNTPDPENYVDGDIVLKEGNEYIHSEGENTNGRWVHYTDGTLVCYKTGVTMSGTTESTGALYRSASETWSFPVAFDSTPVVLGDVTFTTRWLISTMTPTSSTASFRTMGTLNSSDTATAWFYAIGRKAV